MKLGIVVPCYNEAEALPETIGQLSALLAKLLAAGKVEPGSRIHFIDDGSSDGTWSLIEAAAATNPLVGGIKLTHNRGHQLALLAGLLNVPGDALVSLDADLQDDPGAVENMVDACAAGSDIVYGVRSNRSTDTAFKRLTAHGYYRLLRRLGVEIVFNHADFRLMSRRALDALAQYPEGDMFLRGIVPQLGFRTSLVYYERAARVAGRSKYPLWKMIAFAWNGVTSFSSAPLRLITGLGIAVSAASLAVTVWALCIRFLTERSIPGWASTVLPIYFLGGVQLLSVGVIGQYVAKIYAEVKRRPRYVIEKVL
jgi:polyisoprenyl-phosphate glycosyltransferase